MTPVRLTPPPLRDPQEHALPVFAAPLSGEDEQDRFDALVEDLEALRDYLRAPAD